MPERFWLTDMYSPIWRPLDLRTIAPEEPLDVIVRQSPGTSRAAIEAQLKAATEAYIATLPPDRRQVRHRASQASTGTPLGESVALVLPYLLGVSVLLTLLMACANAAILMIAQWTAPTRIAIRASIGAGRGRSSARCSPSRSSSPDAPACSARIYVCASRLDRRAGRRRCALLDLSINVGMLAQVAALTLFTGLLPA